MEQEEIKPRYVDPADASRYLGLSVRQVRRLIKDGRLPASKVTPGQQGHVRIRIDHLDELMTAARIEPGR